jgi:hypothetical protein
MLSSSDRNETMASVTFDTLKFAKQLEAAGVSAQHAEAKAEAFAEATSQELATKADLALLEARLSARIEAVESKLEAMESGLVLKLGSLTVAILVAIEAFNRFFPLAR